MVEVAQILNELHALGNPRTVAQWRKMGFSGDHFYGVPLMALQAMAKKMKRNQEIARALWATQVHDARILATYLAEPKKMPSEELDRWVAEAEFWDVSDKICTNMVLPLSVAPEKMRQWRKSTRQFMRRSGWLLLVKLVKSTTRISEDELEQTLDQITDEIDTAPHWVKEVMILAIIAIGQRSFALKAQAIKAAQAVHDIVMQAKETTLHLPDPVSVLTKK